MEKYFKEALKEFTYDVASGGAIEHLANLGYTPSQIHGMLDFPTPLERVKETYYKWCVKNKIIVEDESEFSRGLSKSHFVTEYDEYGHKSFRKVIQTGACEGADITTFKTVTYMPGLHGTFKDFLKEYSGISENDRIGSSTEQNTELNATPNTKQNAASSTELNAKPNTKLSAASSTELNTVLNSAKNLYVTCDFGRRAYRDKEAFASFLSVLTDEERNYIKEIPWKLENVWHVMDARMSDIVLTLREQSAYHGEILNLYGRERLIF